MTKWTCGQCGDSYQADDWVEVGRWERQHKQKHLHDELRSYGVVLSESALRDSQEGG